jgi:type IV pilus assembly protein PilV
MLMIVGMRRRCAGFSMIEVLVSLLITVVGVLGMVALQSKAIPYTQDSVQRNTAMMLVDDLVETLRASTTCTGTNDCMKAPGAPFPSGAANCIPTPAVATQQIGCWANRARASLPGADDLAVNSFYICRSVLAGDVKANACGTSTAVDTEVEIQVAWKVKSASDCLDGGADGICTYKLRTRL